MSDELNYKTFDLATVLSGGGFPETSVEVYFDEKLGFTINRLTDAIREADIRGNSEIAQKLQSERDELVKKVEDIKYVVHLKGISEGEKTRILQTVRAEFPPQRDWAGREEENLEADQKYQRLLWSAVIQRIEAPDGAVAFIDEAGAKKLQEEAPKSAQRAIGDAIRELADGASAGFEFAAKQVDFLSTASPEG